MSELATRLPQLRGPVRRWGRGLMLGTTISLLGGIVSGCKGDTSGSPFATLPPATSVVAEGGEVGRAAYAEQCSGCHGDGRSSGNARNLFDVRFLIGRSDADIYGKILSGAPEGGMPPFEGVLNEAQIRAIISHLRTEARKIAAGTAKTVESIDGKEFHTRDANVRVETVAGGLDTPWAVLPLVDGRMLVTERPGRMRVILPSGEVRTVNGLPKPYVRQDAGMLDVAVDPDFRSNGWIYLSYVEILPGFVPPPQSAGPVAGSKPPTMLVIVRGRLSADNQWVDSQIVFRADGKFYATDSSHYGTRLVFDRSGHLYFSIGDRGTMADAQRLDTPQGKIHRILRNGLIPEDNPFVGQPGAIGSIWSFGHRNPQGLAWNPATGSLWESEHGPTGGDEINQIKRGRNYGWGLVTKGVQRGITLTSAPGMEDPKAFYTPTIAPSGINFYTGNRFPGWQGDLFVSGLAGQQLRRIVLNGDEIVDQEIIFRGYGRVRSVVTGYDGYLYVLIQNPTGDGTGIPLMASAPGALIRLVPVE